MVTLPLLVTASAGTGKTHRLTSIVADALAGTEEPAIAVEGLVAVTFTNRAHAELASRIRRVLVARGDFDRAAQLPMAYVGTVHSVCMRFIEEVALDAGLPPFLEILPEDGGRRLRTTIEAATPSPTLARLDELARRLEILFDSRTSRHDWPRRASQIMDLARTNRIATRELAAMGQRSVDGLLAFLGPPVSDRASLDHGFDVAIAAALQSLSGSVDSTAKTQKVRRALVEIQQRRSRGDHRWSDWVRAARLDPAVASRTVVEPVITAAGLVARHPGLRDDLREFTVTLFEVCARVIDDYTAWKTRRRIVDFIDMVEQALRLVDAPEVSGELSRRLELVVVDEFQDTSPIQLALFTRLHRLAGRSVWVGDAKQCIFEFAGADPMLIAAMSRWSSAQGGQPERLTRNFRSRPGLVDGCSTLFAPLFPDAPTLPERADHESLAPLPPFGVWWLRSSTGAEDAEAIALATARLLRDEHLTPVLDRQHGVVRAVAARDIGILVATNAEARLVAAGLQRRGVPVSMARDGLLATPEGRFVAAALRWLVEPGDWFSQLTLEALLDWNGKRPDDWLSEKLGAAEASLPLPLTALAGLRERLRVLSPAEILDRVVHILDVPSMCARWPSPQQRLGNLDALRALAARYEQRCDRQRDQATTPGLLRFFDESQRTTFLADGERASDDQFAGGDGDQVTICTYHRAKGLEWPVVVLGSLDRDGRRDAFDPCPESDHETFDADDPLAGRWIRYWAWPFGQRSFSPLGDAAALSQEGRRVAHRERLERQRLLYVGFTRARDHLVLAARWAGERGRTTWLDELADDEGMPLLELPAPNEDDSASVTEAAISLAGRAFRCRVMAADPGGDLGLPWPTPRRLERGDIVSSSTAPYRITPSSAAARTWNEPVLSIARIHRGTAIPVPRSTDWERLGTAVHGFLGADLEDDPTLRRMTARRFVAHAGLPVDPHVLLDVGDRLHTTVSQRWPAATWEREVPITAFVESESGRQRVEGVIDLLLRVPGGVIVVDHKTFPAANDSLVLAHATKHLHQLAAYCVALERCGETVLHTCLHFPIAGYWVDVDRR